MTIPLSKKIYHETLETHLDISPHQSINYREARIEVFRSAITYPQPSAYFS